MIVHAWCKTILSVIEQKLVYMEVLDIHHCLHSLYNYIAGTECEASYISKFLAAAVLYKRQEELHKIITIKMSENTTPIITSLYGSDFVRNYSCANFSVVNLIREIRDNSLLFMAFISTYVCTLSCE